MPIESAGSRYGARRSSAAVAASPAEPEAEPPSSPVDASSSSSPHAAVITTRLRAITPTPRLTVVLIFDRLLWNWSCRIDPARRSQGVSVVRHRLVLDGAGTGGHAPRVGGVGLAGRGRRFHGLRLRSGPGGVAPAGERH